MGKGQLGLECALCGEILTPMIKGTTSTGIYVYSSYQNEKTKHEDTNDCLKYLAGQVKELRDIVFDLQNPNYYDD